MQSKALPAPVRVEIGFLNLGATASPVSKTCIYRASGRKSIHSLPVVKRRCAEKVSRNPSSPQRLIDSMFTWPKMNLNLTKLLVPFGFQLLAFYEKHLQVQGMSLRD
jgi:hypothetical protein